MNTLFLLYAKYGTARLNVEQIADYMGVGVERVRNMIYADELPFAVYKEGKNHYADLADVARVHDENIETARKLKKAREEQTAPA